jgi:uncharacterized protein (TIGR02678 family)
MITVNPELQAERRSALRALLRSPLLPASGVYAEEYALVRRHSQWLKEWLNKFPMWDLHVDAHIARLRKTPADVFDVTRSAIDRVSGTPFTRRRYALFCLALASLEKSDLQTTVGQLARAISEIVAGDRELQSAGLSFDAANYDHRRDLMHAMRLLVDIGVLHRLDGDELQFLNRNGALDVLYDVDRHVLASMLQVPRSPAALEATMRQLAQEPVRARAAKLNNQELPATEEGRTQRVRSRLVRSLLDDPVLYFDDLNEEEGEYLGKERGYLLRQIFEATGLIAEIRAEGIAMVDDSGDLSDLTLAADGSDGRLNLMLLQWLAQSSRSGETITIPVSAAEAYLRAVIHAGGSDWEADVREPGAEVRIRQDALSRFEALRLINLTADGIVPLSACGRYGTGKED